MKECRSCGNVKSLDQFHKNKRHKLGVSNECKFCRSSHQKESFRAKWFQKTTLLKKSECKKKGLPFDLDAEFLESIWTDFCPVFGKAFVRHDKTSPWCPALDRLDPTKGYVKGNVIWISSRANRIKYDATLDELRQLVRFLEGATTIPQGSTLK